MSKLGLRYTSPAGVRGHLYFYIMDKQPGKNGGTVFTIQVQELMNESETEIPVYQFTGYYNIHKDRYTLYPKKRINASVLDFPFMKTDISSAFVYDVAKMHTELPPELRMYDMRPVPENISLDEIF